MVVFYCLLVGNASVLYYYYYPLNIYMRGLSTPLLTFIAEYNLEHNRLKRQYPQPQAGYLHLHHFPILNITLH